MPLLTWQLWLARETVEHNPLPWQKTQPIEQLTPRRVAQSFSAVLAVIGSPAPEPKLRGKPSGWTKGKNASQKFGIRSSKNDTRLHLNPESKPHNG